jgi:dTDP-glucose 4,6-dehydratase
MNKIIVTGGLGFIGSNLIDVLLDKSFFVINIDKVSYSSNFYNLKQYKFNKRYKFIKCDIGDKKILKILNRYKPICIFNLAAETHVDRSIDNPQKFIESNIVSFFNFLDAFKNFSKKYKSRLIHISTDEVYGDVLTGRSSENYSYKPSSPYAASKAAADHLVRSYVRTYRIPAIVTNCSNNYGPKQHPEKFIPKIIYNILNNKPIPIYGNGLNTREWIFVKDHCEALIKVFKKGKIGETYNIGSNKNLTNLQVSKLIINLSKKVINLSDKIKINFVKDRPGHDLRYALNSSKIKTELNWSPKIDFKKGIKLTLDWYKNNKNYYRLLSKKDIIMRLGKDD